MDSLKEIIKILLSEEDTTVVNKWFNHTAANINESWVQEEPKRVS